jgi:hypothetical protein
MEAGSMPGFFAKQSGRWVAGIVLSAAVAVALWPEPAARLLTPGPDWAVEGHPEQSVTLGGLHHASHFLRDSVRLNPDTRFWRVWTPSQGDLPLAISSPPFLAPPLLSIPVTGDSSGVSGPAAIWLEHLGSGQRKAVFFGATHSSFNDVLVAVPPQWVGSETRLRFQSGGKRNSGTGSVFATSGLSWLKSTFVGRLPVLLGGMTIWGFLLFTGAAVAVRAGRQDLVLPLALVQLAVTALAVFYLSVALQVWGVRPAAAARLACGSAGLAAAVTVWVVGRRARNRAWGLLRPYGSLWVFATLLITSLCGAANTGTGHWEPNYRFWPATWSTDHELPWRFAEGIRHGEPLATIFGEQWRPTDRPPLMAAAYLLIGDLVDGSQSFNDGRYLTGVLYNTAGVALNALWIPVAFWVARKLGADLPRRHVLLITCFAATVPYSFFTTTYGWPKAFGAAFALACFGLVIDEHRRLAGSPARILCLAALAALSLLAHAGTAFFLAPLGLLFTTGLSLRAWKPVVGGCLIAGLLLGSWAAFKRILLPSNDPVTKYALTESFGFDQPGLTVVDLVRQRYTAMSLTDWLWLKRQMVVDAITPLRSPPAQALRATGGDASRIGFLRAWDFHVPTFGNAAVWLTVCMVAGLALWRKRPAAGDPAARILILLAVVSLLAYVVVCLASPMLHHLPTAAWFGMAIGGGVCLARRSPCLFMVLLATQLSYFAIVWLIHPLMHAISVDVSALGSATALLMQAVIRGPSAVRRPAEA